MHDRSILVEAGAGSGKTAVMAGRIAVMLAEGIAPKSIAAVTFTELAASELLIRVRDFVGDLAAGHIAPELRVALPAGLSEVQQAHLLAASASIDEITCSTIHGFCQRLIKPYPVEADIDPGASVMDRNQADLAFVEIVVKPAARTTVGTVEARDHRRNGASESGRDGRADPQNRREPAPLAHGVGPGQYRRWRSHLRGFPRRGRARSRRSSALESRAPKPGDGRNSPSTASPEMARERLTARPRTETPCRVWFR